MEANLNDFSIAECLWLIMIQRLYRFLILRYSKISIAVACSISTFVLLEEYQKSKFKSISVCL